MLIQNYGLFWRPEDVYWGKPNQTGTLLGEMPGNRGDPIDFRDQCGIYVLYSEFNIVYIGQAGARNQKLFARLKNHRRDHLAGRWDSFSWFGTRKVNDSGSLRAPRGKPNSTHENVLDHVEGILIYASEPPLNRQGGKFGNEVEQYLQYRDERLGPPVQDMIEQIWRKRKEAHL